MSQETLQAIIGMAIIDREFREQLLSSPVLAVNGLALNAGELAMLRSIKADTLEEFAARLEFWRSKLPVEEGRRSAAWIGDLVRIAG